MPSAGGNRPSFRGMLSSARAPPLRASQQALSAQPGPQAGVPPRAGHSAAEPGQSREAAGSGRHRQTQPRREAFEVRRLAGAADGPGNCLAHEAGFGWQTQEHVQEMNSSDYSTRRRMMRVKSSRHSQPTARRHATGRSSRSGTGPKQEDRVVADAAVRATSFPPRRGADSRPFDLLLKSSFTSASRLLASPREKHQRHC